MLNCFKRAKKRPLEKTCQAEFFVLMDTQNDACFDLWLKSLKSYYPSYELSEIAGFIAEQTTGRTWLHYAVSSKYLYAIQELMDLGADMYLLDKNGESALDLAEQVSKDIHAVMLEFKDNPKPIYKVGH